ncbi:MAG: helix-turn-helix domain-containing protein [Solirubrobacteraceae bacterium]
MRAIGSSGCRVRRRRRSRALICWASATRMSAQQIAALVGTDESHVRKVIHAFNERGGLVRGP